MLFQKRIDRAFRHQSESNQDRDKGEREDLEPSDLMEKGDLAAMILAAVITILPVALLVLLIMAAAGWLFLRL